MRLAEAVADGLRAEGFEVDVVHDGDRRAVAGPEGDYDAIVLDILLPGINGYRVCRTLREDGVMTPILMLTAKDGEYDEAEALDTGADDFLSKPFSFVVLVARLRALIRRGAPPGRRAPGRRPRARPRHPPCAARRHRDPPHAREFALLEVLMRKDGNVGPSASCSRRCGASTSPATRTSSRCTSATCAARSTSPSSVGPSRPSAASATAWCRRMTRPRRPRIPRHRAHRCRSLRAPHGRGD